MSLKWTTFALVPTLALGLAACSDDSSTDDTTEPTPTATIEMTVTPDPATAVAAEDQNYTWQVDLEVNFVETGGVGVTISQITFNVQESSGGVVLTSDEEEVVRGELDVASNYIAANGTNTVGLRLSYTLPNGGREAIVTVTATLQDDNENTGTFQDQITAQ
jgi:hypothetical protein